MTDKNKSQQGDVNKQQPSHPTRDRQINEDHGRERPFGQDEGIRKRDDQPPVISDTIRPPRPKK